MTARIETSRARAPEARCRLAALLRRAPGATVPTPRPVLCALLDAVEAAERRADALAEDIARARVAFADSLRDRDALAAALDAAGWVTRIERMRDGQTGLLRVVAPAQEGKR